MHLRPRLTGGVAWPRADPRRGRDDRPRRGAADADREPVRAERHGARPRPLPRQGRPRRGAAGELETAYRVSFFGDEVESISHFDPLTGEIYARLDNLVHLAGDGVRHLDADDRARGRRRPRTSSRSRCGRSSRRGSCSRRTGSEAAHRVRPRDDARARLLLRDRELLAPPRGPAARLASVHAPRLLPGRLRRLRRRVAPDGPAARRHVRGRPLPQADARRLRIPAALGARQPAAPLRRVPRARAAARLRLRDAGAVRAPQYAGHRRAADPADVRGRPGGRGARDEEPDRRPAERDPPPRRGGRARARHDADEEDGRGPDRLPARGRASRLATFTRRSTRSSGSGSSETSVWASTTSSSA